MPRARCLWCGAFCRWSFVLKLSLRRPERPHILKSGTLKITGHVGGTGLGLMVPKLCNSAQGHCAK